MNFSATNEETSPDLFFEQIQEKTVSLGSEIPQNLVERTSTYTYFSGGRTDPTP